MASPCSLAAADGAVLNEGLNSTKDATTTILTPKRNRDMHKAPPSSDRLIFSSGGAKYLTPLQPTLIECDGKDAADQPNKGLLFAQIKNEKVHMRAKQTFLCCATSR